MNAVLKITLIIPFLTACSLLSPAKGTVVASSSERTEPPGAPAASGEFNYQTTKAVTLTIRTGYPDVPVVVFRDGIVHFRGVSDRNGWIRGGISVPTYYDYLTLSTGYLGLLPEAVVEIKGQALNFDYASPSGMIEAKQPEKGISLRQPAANYKVLGGWDRSGKPDYLTSPDKISSGLLEMVNLALPELKPVPQYHPQYLDSDVQTELVLKEEATVSVTFVHEGAGYRNALGFFQYRTADGPPDSLRDEDITLIFPNVSYKGGGGGLYSGDKVELGRFPAGTTIGWVIIANGYNSHTRTVGRGLNRFFSRESLNPDAPGHKQHVVLLSYPEESLYLLSFEDLKRPYGDNDFNDAVFYVTTDPGSAVDGQGIVEARESVSNDSDGDGVANDLDTEPMNGQVVGYQYTPGENSYGTLAFEDLWPHMGDYDFNDLVIDYRFRESINIHGKIVGIRGEFIITGILASMRNGFALELDLSPSDIESVTGGQYNVGYTALAANGVEERQSRAVIVVFEDAHLHYEPGGVEKKIILDISFSRAVPRETLGYAPYNPFIMSNGERGREVHLPGYPQTDLAHYEYFGSVDDASILGTGSMYKTESNQPWAIHLPMAFRYPKDDVPIFRAYSHFNRWVESKGSAYQDWYTDKDGYRDTGYLF